MEFKRIVGSVLLSGAIVGTSFVALGSDLQNTNIVPKFTKMHITSDMNEDYLESLKEKFPEEDEKLSQIKENNNMIKSLNEELKELLPEKSSRFGEIEITTKILSDEEISVMKEKFKNMVMIDKSLLTDAQLASVSSDSPQDTDMVMIDKNLLTDEQLENTRQNKNVKIKVSSKDINLDDGAIATFEARIGKRGDFTPEGETSSGLENSSRASDNKARIKIERSITGDYNFEVNAEKIVIINKAELNDEQLEKAAICNFDENLVMIKESELTEKQLEKIQTKPLNFNNKEISLDEIIERQEKQIEHLKENLEKLKSNQ